MENKKQGATKIAIAILAILLASTLVMLSSNETISTVSAAPASTHDPVTGEPYGDIMQYEWVTGAGDYEHTKYNAGPAPNSATVLWELETPRSQGIPVAFNGMVFVTNHAWTPGEMGQGELYAFDAFTGEQQWMAYMQYGARGMAQYVTKIDDEYLLLDTGAGIDIYRTATGELVGQATGYYREIPGMPAYWSGAYDNINRIKIMACGDETTQESFIEAIDVSDPENPTFAWRYGCSEASEILCYGDGKFYVGAPFVLYALNSTTGDLIWESPKKGFAGYLANYYNGKVYHAASSTKITVYDGDDGTIIWEYDALNYGDRSFFGGWNGATAYGCYFDKNIQPNPAGYVGCWDAENGELKWKQPAYYHIAYLSPIVADGKVYVTTSDGRAVAGRPGVTSAFSCFDAFTGAVIWEIPNFQASNPVVAYGNLYLASGRRLVCISDAEKSDWSMWRGNTDTPGVAGDGPRDISEPKWTYETEDAVTSSPAVVDGKVYVGSQDKNIYCLDAYSGSFIWKFPINYRVKSSPAVVGGRVYTGADDGNIYCINAETGVQIWQKTLYDLEDYDDFTFPHMWQMRSSPIVVGNRIYVGALDGNVYCLDTSGNIVWTYPTGNAIGGSPTVSGGIVYIGSTDRYIYALDAANGNLVWKTETPARPVVNSYRQKLSLNGSPIVVDGKVYMGVGWDSDPKFACFDAQNGTIIWNITVHALGYPTYPVFTPTYFDGVLYITGGMAVAGLNATDGSIIWEQWLGHETFSSCAVADDLGGAIVYCGSDVFSVTALSTSGEVLSVYTTGAEVQGSPAIWDDKLYIGSGDHNVYCFSDEPTVEMYVFAESDKGAQMWSNETMTICGELHAIQTNNATGEVFYPGIMDATVLVTLIDPDLNQIDVTATTDMDGNFEVSYSPTKVGDWSWMAWYEGQAFMSHSYSEAFGEANFVEVTSPPTEEPNGNGEEPPPEEGIPMEYVYAIVAVIAIAVIAIAAYAYMRRKK